MGPASTTSMLRVPTGAQTDLPTPPPHDPEIRPARDRPQAKTEGPYRSSVKRVTHNAASLAAHLNAAEDMRRTQRELGKDRRAFAAQSA